MGEKKPKREKPGRMKRKSSRNETLTLAPTKRRHGPRLPSSLRKELDGLNPNPEHSDSDAGLNDEDHHLHDLYEYEEALPEEESKKNRRYDPVDNYEYELPEDFNDEDIASDDECLASEDDDAEERHLRMLHDVTGMPGEAFQGKKRKRVVFSEFDKDESDTKISIHDLLDPLESKPGFSTLRKRLEKAEQQQMAVQPPLPKVKRERIERDVATKHFKKDITRWEPLVKMNREAPTLYFKDDTDLGFSTVGAIASEFEPRTEFEKKMAVLVRDPEVTEAHWKDGARLLEHNKISIEDVKDRQHRLAKMRSLLFKHEMKAKHIKKIKSKAYHRILKKEKLKGASAAMQIDTEAAKEDALKQEFKRAEERMTLKHKNTSKWARRVLERGLNAQDEGTRAAISEQLHKHELLTRKMNSLKDNDDSSSDDSSDDDVEEEASPGTNGGGVSKIISKAKEKTVKLMEEEDDMPTSGVLSLPFMKRGLEKQKVAAHEDARLVLEEYDSSLRQLEDDGETENPTSDKTSGRKVFVVNNKKSKSSRIRTKSENIEKGSDSEVELETRKHEDEVNETDLNDEVNIRAALHDESQMDQESLYKNFNDIAKDPGPKTTYEVAIFASDSWKKVKSENTVDRSNGNTTAAKNHDSSLLDVKAVDQCSDPDSDEEMVDGILSAGAKLQYELPTQTDLIQRAFAGDDVEAEFEKDKMDVLNEEIPEPEKPVLLPGWGQWTHVQQRKGTPSWMLEEHEKAKKKRDEALKKRKDSHLRHVIISEKIDKKAEKLYTKTLPSSCTKEVYDQSISMPIGPEYNPAILVGALNRPSIVKKPGTIIKPIKYEEVDPHAKGDEPKNIGQKPTAKETKSTSRKKPKKISGGKRS